MNEPIKLIFMSFRDSIDMDGLKVSINKYAPKLCSYPILSYLIMPITRNLTRANMERIHIAILDNNWDLICDFINEVYDLGLRQIVFCCWCTREQIAGGKICSSGTIGKYIQDKADRDSEFKFAVEIEYGDGRSVL